MRISVPFVYLAAALVSAHAGLVENILASLSSGPSCESCQSLFTTLKPVAMLGDQVLTNTFITICKALHLHDNDVCEGLIGQQAPIIAHDLRVISVPGQTSTKLCHALLGFCQEPSVNPVTLTFPRATPLKTKSWTSKGRTPFKVVHLSDVHLDRHYEVGADATCTKPICCRTFADDTSPIERPAGPHGMLKCDSPTALVQNLLVGANAVKSKFNIFTGDVADGATWLYSQQENTASMQLFNQELKSQLKSRTFPAVGNHEASPTNAFPRNTTSQVDVQWVFDTQSQGWRRWLDHSATSQVKHNSGSYSMVVPGTSLRILSLNTNYWYKQNYWLYDTDNQQPDPNGVLAFAIKQLQAAEDARDRVWIIGHMPPSHADSAKDQSNYFDQIVQRYSNTIAAQFYGHSHVDEFVTSYSDWSNTNADTAISVQYLAPSITPRDGNPAFRVYEVDPDTYEIMDSKTIMAELSSPSFQTAPTWITQYSARQFYSSAIGGWPANMPLNAKFWHKVTQAFETNDALFTQFVAFKDRGGTLQTCDAACKTKTICNLRAGRTQNGCHSAIPGFSFNKRDVTINLSAPGHSHHCEGAGMPSVFSGALLKMQSSEGEASGDQLKAALSHIIVGTQV